METTNKIQPGRKYTQFYNDILDRVIDSKFGSLEIKVILAIVRRTYGFHKKEVAISLRLFERMIKTNHWNIFKVLERLVEAKIIFQNEGPKMKNNNPVHKYSINEASIHCWNTRAGLSNTPETGALETPIKDKKKILKERMKSLVDKMQMH